MRTASCCLLAEIAPQHHQAQCVNYDDDFCIDYGSQGLGAML